MPFHEAEHLQRLMHEQQQTERRRPGEKHHAKAQQIAEDIFRIDVQRLKHQDRQHSEEQQNGAVALRQGALFR